MGHNIKRIIKEEYVNYMLNERLDDIEKLHEAKWNFSEPAVRRAAALLAKAMTKVDGVKIKVHDFEWDEGRGAGFELSWDGDKGDGGSYGISDKGEVINHAYPGNPVYGHIKSSERDFEKGIRKYSKRRNESINEGKEYYVIQSLKTGKPKYVKDVGWKVRDNPMWVSDRNISKAYKYKTLKDARKYLESYPPQQTEFWHIYKMPSGNADLGPDLKESINEGKSFYQDVVDLNKSFRLLKIQSPDSYKEIDKKFKVRDIQKLLSNIKTFMDTVPAMREGKVNEAQLQDLPIRSLLGLGVKATVNMGEKKLYDLSEAFEGWLIDNDDNTYEGITAHLDMAIELIQEREPKEAKPHLKKFNKECAKALKEMRRFDEAKFNKKSLMKAMKKADGMITVDRGKQYIIYNPKKGDDSNIKSDSGREGQDFWDMWQAKVVFGVDEDGEEHEIRYSDIESYNESINEAQETFDSLKKLAKKSKTFKDESHLFRNFNVFSFTYEDKGNNEIKFRTTPDKNRVNVVRDHAGSTGSSPMSLKNAHKLIKQLLKHPNFESVNEAKLPKRFTVNTKQTFNDTTYNTGTYALKKKRAGGGIYLNMDNNQLLGVDAGDIAKLSESDAEYANSLQTIARDKQLKMLSKKDKETLLKIADLMKRANEGTVDVSEEQMAVLKEKLVFYVDKKGKKRRFDTDASANKKYTKK